MRELTTFEIANVAGAKSDLREAIEDLVVGTAVGMVQLLVFATGTATVGAAAGHIGGTVMGYQLATRAGASTAQCCLSGIGAGVAGAVVGSVAAVHAGFWALNNFYRTN